MFFQDVTRMQAGKLRSSSLTVQMNSELLSVLARLCETGLPPSDIPSYAEQFCEMLCAELNEKCGTMRGAEVFSMPIELL